MVANPRVAVVTGASQGIGAGLVKSFLSHGYQIVANSRNIKTGLFASDQVLEIPGDISRPEIAQQVITAAIEKFGRIDTLVNNAGIFIAKPFTEYSIEDYERVITVNLSGFFYVTQQAIHQMLSQGSGHIVQITTSLADQPIKGLDSGLASLSKGGLNAVTRALAIEYADRGIRVNAVSPGVIKTAMHAPETHDFLASLHPMNRMGEVTEIAEAVLYLDSATFVTGEILHVDGGEHAGKW
ncbi:SDR family NAD(P)-dependent oxidoreductase [Gimesia sp.]|uniref:SDR family NAD(P)-dependent oxidoreductase n=1 Tax=Gimesia sp. TaxID=2024833 RepID=UPI003A9145FA